MSKKIILDNLVVQSQGDYFRQDIEDVMDEWVKEEIINFATWLNDVAEIPEDLYNQYQEYKSKTNV